jgi:sterol desaturase/sphingolipid hydroxylase (fatty acid hydroxylase superfamily)
MDPAKEIIKADLNRYKRKGTGLIVAAFIAIAFLLGLPKLGELIWPTAMFITSSNSHILFSAGVFISHIIASVGNHSLFALLYRIEHPFFEKYKLSSKPWPWNKDNKKWKIMFKKTMRVILINALVVFPIVVSIEPFFAGVSYNKEIEGLPSSFELLWQLSFCMFCEDFTSYHTHKAIHHKWIYPYIHKLHHEYYMPICISAEFAHPVEFIVSNMLPSVIGPKLLGHRIHLFTVMIWTAFRTTETIEDHSGYEFSFSPYRFIPFCGSASYHDFHHTHNIGNYSSFFHIWDSVFGTNVAYFNHLKLKEKLDRENPENIEINSEINKLE